MTLISEEINQRLRATYNPDGSTLRKAQLRMVDLLAFIDQLCTENKLTYWIDSGTLLGAARHGGFIPWDDDADVCMPVEDLLKFKEIMVHRNPSTRFVLQCHETDPHFFGQWMVLRDLHSEYLQDDPLHQIRKYRGLQVDLFPMEKISSFPLSRIASLSAKYLLTSPFEYFKPNRFLLGFASVSHAFLYKILFPLCRTVDKLFPEKDFYRMTYGILFKSKRYPKHIYPLERIEFEGHQFNAPHDYDSYLTALYGNWKQLPAADQIHTHEVNIIFTDGSAPSQNRS